VCLLADSAFLTILKRVQPEALRALRLDRHILSGDTAAANVALDLVRFFVQQSQFSNYLTYVVVGLLFCAHSHNLTSFFL